MPFDTISVIGLGYIGLPTAAVFASRKKRVIGVDVSQHAIDTINRGEIHIIEPQLDIVVRAAVSQGYLRATSTPEPADAFLIAVPTPFKDDHVPDLSFIENAARSIAPSLRPGNIVVLESTSPVGATEQMAEWLAEARPDLTFPQQKGESSDIRIAHCPERVLPGHVIRELVQNDRVIGGMTAACSKAAVDLYKTFVEGECITTNARTAEMCKLTENASRDVGIAFANELSMICDAQGIDVWELIRLANHHPRVNILQPGPGVGGHCIAVDPWFIVSANPEQARLIKTAREVNDAKPDWVLKKTNDTIAKVARLLEGHRKPRLAIAGLTFKPDIDDLRESPAMKVAEKLAQRSDIDITIVEPNIESLPAKLARHNHSFDIADAARWCDVLLVLVDHSAFKKMAAKIPADIQIIDTRGMLRY